MPWGNLGVPVGLAEMTENITETCILLELQQAAEAKCFRASKNETREISVLRERLKPVTFAYFLTQFFWSYCPSLGYPILGYLTGHTKSLKKWVPLSRALQHFFHFCCMTLLTILFSLSNLSVCILLTWSVLRVSSHFIKLFLIAEGIKCNWCFNRLLSLIGIVQLACWHFPTPLSFPPFGSYKKFRFLHFSWWFFDMATLSFLYFSAPQSCLICSWQIHATLYLPPFCPISFLCSFALYYINLWMSPWLSNLLYCLTVFCKYMKARVFMLLLKQISIMWQSKMKILPSWHVICSNSVRVMKSGPL